MTLKYPPPSSWGNSKHKNPNSITSLTDPPTIPRYIRKNKANQSSGKFQYIRIELCEGGDIESHMRLLENKSFEIHQVCVIFWLNRIMFLLDLICIGKKKKMNANQGSHYFIYSS